MTLGMASPKDSPMACAQRWGRVVLGIAMLALLPGLAACPGGGSDEMPEVVAKPEAEARSQLEELGLSVTVERKRDGGTPGTVIEQTPRAGEPIPDDGNVTIVVADAAAGGPAAVPNVVGTPAREAEQQIVQAGFVRGAMTRQFSSEPVDTVIEQNPRAGTVAAPGSLVDLVVADNTMVNVPNVVGDEEGEALRKLTEGGLRMGEVERVLQGPGAVGRVLEQNPRAELMVLRDTPINLRVKEDAVQVPRVQGKLLKEVSTELLRSGLRYRLAYRHEPNVPAETILHLSPQGGRLVARNSEVELTLATRFLLDRQRVSSAAVEAFQKQQQHERAQQLLRRGAGVQR